MADEQKPEYGTTLHIETPGGVVSVTRQHEKYNDYFRMYYGEIPKRQDIFIIMVYHKERMDVPLPFYGDDDKPVLFASRQEAQTVANIESMQMEYEGYSLDVALASDYYTEPFLSEEWQRQQSKATRPLVKCLRCEKYTNPITLHEYKVKNNIPESGIRNGAKVCEFCGWKIPKAKP